MYLKRIEAQGFKSFANKTVLEFNQGIMGIVGPNGSGKSNVADAVRWVLGEQSAKQLRGSNMQDVIFSGTESRKPHGYASVALTIDNRDHLLAVDYEEVTVARRVYRSGESEYLLNGHLCRLRDIQELFYDTGVGKEGYSLIGQGQIDRILSGRPEDRRELFDEAAGIVKYKKRKHITQKKLDTEEGNLLRVTDILQELEKQVGPLAKQSEKARQYLKWKEELKGADICSFRLETADHRRRLAEAEQNLAIVNGDRDKTNQEAGQSKERYDAIQEQLQALEETLEETRRELGEKQVYQEKLEGQVRALEQQLQSARTQEENLRERMAVLTAEAQDKEEQRTHLQEQREQLNRQRDECEQEVEEAARKQSLCQNEIHNRETRQEEGQRQLRELLEKKANLAAGLERAETMLEQANLRKARLQEIFSETQSEESELAAQVEQITKRLAESQQEGRERREELIRAQRELAEAEQALKDRNGKLAEYQQQYHVLKSRRESLLNIAERYEGYGSSIRRIMERKAQTPGIRGVVADLFHAEKKYETAIETALGGRIQNIVTDTEHTAKELIAYLKQRKLGRATFLPMSSVHGREGFPRPEALREPGALGVASEIVTVEEEYQGIASYLLGRILVVDTISHALAIAAKYRYTLNIVTLEGESLSPGGAITGGSYRNNSNLLGRRREIRELAAEIRKVLEQYDICKDEVMRWEQKTDRARKQIDSLRQEVHERELERNTLTIDLSLRQTQMEDLKQGALSRDEEQKAVEEQIASWKRERQETLEKMDRTDEACDRLEQAGMQENRVLEEKRQELEDWMEELGKVRQRAAALTQKAGFLGENINRLTGECVHIQEEYKALQNTLTKEAEAETNRREERENLLRQIERERENCLVLESRVREQTVRREGLGNEQQQIFKDREELGTRINRLDHEAFRLEHTVERLEEQISKLVDYIWTEYGLTPSEAEQMPGIKKMSLAESRREVAAAKAQIKELGPVNVNAIEEYREVSERYEFLKEQHADLVQASESLKKIIRDLETGMRKQFKEKFADIQTEFDRVFRELFGGGKGTLELQEASDILDAGIIINAQPPGKKLQNMLQLSGGEKALSAIALLFAIQNLKPSPFCMLDEIEAALDEPNVERFARYLDKLKKQTQFIVITHRRGTMEIADRLYGITMQEKGVSALVSVDLTQAALDDYSNKA